MSPDDRVRVNHMVEAIDAATRFLTGRSRIVGMRNRVVHAYFDVDLNILWDTLTQSLPPLRVQLGAALDQPA